MSPRPMPALNNMTSRKKTIFSSKRKKSLNSSVSTLLRRNNISLAKELNKCKQELSQVTAMLVESQEENNAMKNCKNRFLESTNIIGAKVIEALKAVEILGEALNGIHSECKNINLYNEMQNELLTSRLDAFNHRDRTSRIMSLPARLSNTDLLNNGSKRGQQYRYNRETKTQSVNPMISGFAIHKPVIELQRMDFPHSADPTEIRRSQSTTSRRPTSNNSDLPSTRRKFPVVRIQPSLEQSNIPDVPEDNATPEITISSDEEDDMEAASPVESRDNSPEVTSSIASVPSVSLERISDAHLSQFSQERGNESVVNNYENLRNSVDASARALKMATQNLCLQPVVTLTDVKQLLGANVFKITNNTNVADSNIACEQFESDSEFEEETSFEDRRKENEEEFRKRVYSENPLEGPSWKYNCLESKSHKRRRRTFHIARRSNPRRTRSFGTRDNSTTTNDVTRTLEAEDDAIASKDDATAYNNETTSLGDNITNVTADKDLADKTIYDTSEMSFTTCIDGLIKNGNATAQLPSKSQAKNVNSESSKAADSVITIDLVNDNDVDDSDSEIPPSQSIVNNSADNSNVLSTVFENDVESDIERGHARNQCVDGVLRDDDYTDQDDPFVDFEYVNPNSSLNNSISDIQKVQQKSQQEQHSPKSPSKKSLCQTSTIPLTPEKRFPPSSAKSSPSKGGSNTPAKTPVKSKNPNKNSKNTHSITSQSAVKRTPQKNLSDDLVIVSETAQNGLTDYELIANGYLHESSPRRSKQAKISVCNSGSSSPPSILYDQMDETWVPNKRMKKRKQCGHASENTSKSQKIKKKKSGSQSDSATSERRISRVPFHRVRRTSSSESENAPEIARVGRPQRLAKKCGPGSFVEPKLNKKLRRS